MKMDDYSTGRCWLGGDKLWYPKYSNSNAKRGRTGRVRHDPTRAARKHCYLQNIENVAITVFCRYSFFWSST